MSSTKPASDLEWWQQKLVQLLHDPVHKLLVLYTGVGHRKEAARLSQAVVGEVLRSYNASPDWLASGADRPNVGNASTCRVDWRVHPLITHPLQPGICFRPPTDGIPVGRGSRSLASQMTEALVAYWEERFADSGSGKAEDTGGDEEEVESRPAAGRAWHDVNQVRSAFLRVWRLAPVWASKAGVPLPWLPADSRSPDHSIESHTRIASAAAFLARPKRRRPPEREPCLLVVSVRGVQDFIAETRKTRDLWTACMIYAELTWAAMEPIVERYGPDAVVYPDLRGNPFADQWLWNDPGAGRESLPDPVVRSGAATYAAVLPNTFVALVPRGGADGMERVEDLAGSCRDAVGARWRALADSVERWLRKQVGDGPWTHIWDRQLSRAPDVAWTATIWQRRMDRLNDLPDMQAPGFPEVQAPQLEERARVLGPWMDQAIFDHYEDAQRVFWQVDGLSTTRYLRNERGFDYPLVHHALRTAHAVRKLALVPAASEEPGEKCSVTGRHEVLSNVAPGTPRSLGSRRRDARRFWADSRLDPAADGSERLGGPAALKRYLVAAGEETFTRRWAGLETQEDSPKVPFPSTAAIAAGRFLVYVAEHVQRFQHEIDAVVEAGEKGFATQDPRCLPRLAMFASRSESLRKFLSIEAEYLFPEALRTLIDRKPGEAKPIERMRDAVVNLRKAVQRGDPGSEDGGAPREVVRHPETGVAVLVMDGDRMGRLLLGDPRVIAAAWRDVLHPAAVERIENGPLAETGWPALLDAPRHMGPSLHAAITRMLADFVHRIAPWVVEREFGGRLIYAGGDDLLALLPARDAIPAAARLQQLFSAPFVVDTCADLPAWSWRRDDVDPPPSPDGAWERRRFRVPVGRTDEEPGRRVISWSDGEEEVLEAEFHAGTGERQEIGMPDENTDLFPMLGRPYGMSAGLALGHYKTSLRALIAAARGNLALAKALPPRDVQSGPRRSRLGAHRSGIAVTRFTRSGSKDTWVSYWHLDVPSGELDGADGEGGGAAAEHPGALLPEAAPPSVWLHLNHVVEAFRRGHIARRFPYQLQATLEAMSPLPRDPGDRRRLLEGMVARHASPETAEPVRKTVLAILEAGLAYHPSVTRRAGGGAWGDTPHGPTIEQDGRFAVSGLLLARYLAGMGGRS